MSPLCIPQTLHHMDFIIKFFKFKLVNLTGIGLEISLPYDETERI